MCRTLTSVEPLHKLRHNKLKYRGVCLYQRPILLLLAQVCQVIPQWLPINTAPYTLLHAVAQLVEAMCYKPEGLGFDSRWCHWNFSLT